jgi:hypothetical protein
MRSFKRYYDDELKDEMGWERSTHGTDEILKVYSANLRGSRVETGACIQRGCGENM